MKIVILDAYSVNPGDLSWESIEALGDVVVYDRTKPDEVAVRCKEAEIVLTNKVKITAEIFDSLPCLKYVGVMATGYDIIDLKAATAHGVKVTNVPAYSTDHVAQMVFAHLLNITDYVDSFARQNRDGRWTNSADFCYWDKPTHELAAMTMGIVGLGNIGMKVAGIAMAFGMKVMAYTSKPQEQLPEGIQKASLGDVLRSADVLTLHCPLNEQTRYIINRDSIHLMKSSAIVINTGRGPLVDEADMAEALAKGRLQAYAADVMGQEPPAKDNPLMSLPNVFTTPHIAWASQEARVRLIAQLAKNIEAFKNGETLNVVNG